MIFSLILNALWQGALIVGVVGLVLRLVPVENASTRYATWFAGFLALVAVPAVTALVHVSFQLLTLPHRAAFEGAAFSLVPLRPLAVDAANWLAWQTAVAESGVGNVIAALWIAGATLAFARLAVSFLRIARILHGATEISRLEGVPVLASSDLSIPIATGVLSPAIVLPSELVQTLSAKDLRCTIEHELAHLRRGDVAGNAAQRIIEAAFFWNPWIQFVGGQLAAEREAACDDWAVGRLGESREYARCLAELGRRVTRAVTPLFTPSVFGSRNALVTRIERLMSDGSPNDSRLNYFALGAVSMIFVVMTLALQGVVGAPAHATGLDARAETSVVAAGGTTCKNPNAPPEAFNPAPPDLPKSQWPDRKVSAVVLVSVTSKGAASGTHIYRSSGDANVDRAVLIAAKKSTYSAKLAHCVPVAGTYLFKAEFAP